MKRLFWGIFGKEVAKAVATAYQSGKIAERDRIITDLNNDAVILLTMPIHDLDRVVAIIEKRQHG